MQVRITEARSADELLTILYAVPVGSRDQALRCAPKRLLVPAADLCGVDAEGMTPGQAIRAILANF